jgi:poly(3-hydroxybutyrate) depolymerase
MTLMAGPVDARISPTKVNELATGRSIAWFRQHLIGFVPWRYRGAMRRVYPGFVQLAAFMSMNIERHVRAHADLYGHMARGVLRRVLRGDRTARRVLSRDRPEGLPGAPAAPRPARVARPPRRSAGDPAHRAVHGGGREDDISAVGQTVAAQDLCTGLRPYMRRHHVQVGAGHYRVFNGYRWQNEIYPQLRSVIHASG